MNKHYRKRLNPENNKYEIVKITCKEDIEKYARGLTDKKYESLDDAETCLLIDKINAPKEEKSLYI